MRMLTGCLNSLVEDGSQGDGRGLDGRKVCRGVVLAICVGMVDDGNSQDVWSTGTGSPIPIGSRAGELKVGGYAVYGHLQCRDMVMG